MIRAANPEIMAGDLATGIKKNMLHKLQKRSLYCSSFLFSTAIFAF
jgi:hypothetical protein